MNPIPLPYRLLAIAALLAGGIVFGFIKGAAHVQDKWQLADARARAEQTTRIHTITKTINRETVKYLDRVIEIHDLAAQLDKEATNYVDQKSNAACVVPVGFVLLHDAAAAGRAGEGGSTAAAYEAPSEIPLSEVARTVADNYWRGNQNAEQVIALQGAITAMQDGCR